MKALESFLLIGLILTGLTIFSVSNVTAQNSTLPFHIPTNNSFYGPVSAGSTNLGGSKDDRAFSIQQTSDIGLLLTGQTYSYGHGRSDMWLLKTGITHYYLDGVPKGVFQGEKWNITFGGAADDCAYCGIQTLDSGFAAAGYTSSFGKGGMDMCLIKTDFDGKIQWYKTYGGAGDECAFSLIQTSDGGYLLSGYTLSEVASKSAWVVKTDIYGNQEWNKTLSGINVNSAIVTDNGYAFAVECSNAFKLVTTDQAGQINIDQTYPASGKASIKAIVQNDDNGYTLAGLVKNSVTGLNDTFLVKTDSIGPQQWSKTYPGLGAYSLIKTSKDGYALTGEKVMLLITDSNGNVQWNEKYDGSSDETYSSKYPVCMYSIIEASPDHFVMAGAEYNGEYVHTDAQWVQVTLKSGANLITPQVKLTQPQNQVYTSRDIPLTFIVNEPTKFLTVCLNSYNFTVDGNTTLKNLPNGNYTIRIVASDSDYNIGTSQTVSFTVDSPDPLQTPKITLLSPINQIYNTSQVQLKFTVDQQVYNAVYSVDGQFNQTLFSGMTVPLSNGQHTVTVYASGLYGGPEGSDSVKFWVNATHNYIMPNPNQTPSSTYNQVFEQIVQSAVQAATSTEFLVSVAVIFAVAIGGLIVFLAVMVKRDSKRGKQQRMVR
jgi:hypothetical protein